MADRYWVGGTANWDGTAGTKWATTSGGAGGASVPTSADDVFFTNLSTGTCTISSGNTGAKSINCTGFTGTLAGTGDITVSGSVTLVAGMTFSHSGILTVAGTATITSAGKTFGGAFFVNGAGITVSLADAISVTLNLVLTQGTFTTNNFNVTAAGFNSSNSNTRTVNLGSSTVTFTGISPINFGTNTGLTFNAGTSSIICSAAAATIIGGGGAAATGVTFYNVSFTSTTASTHVISSINTFNNLTITAPSAAGVTQVAFDSRQTISGTLSTTGTAGNRRVWFRGATYGLAQTLTINATPSLTDADFRDIYVIGTAAPISGTRVGDLRGCRGITFSTPKTVYWNLAGGGDWTANAWAASSGGAVSTDNFPLAQDTAVIENTGLNTSAQILFDIPNISIGSIDMSLRTNAMTLNINSSGPTTIYGDWKNGSGTTIANTATMTFSGRNTQTITSAGKTFGGGVTVDSYGGSVELADALNIGSNSLTVTNGTFDTKNFNVTAGQLSSTNSNVRTINLGSSTVTLSASTVLNFATSTNLTFIAGTSQINTSASGAATLTGGGNSFYNVSFNLTAAGTHIINGANTFNNLTVTAPTVSSLIQVSFAANQTITGTLTVAGATPVRRIFVRSDTLGTQRTLSVGTLSATDCDFRDIAITGTAAGSSPTRAGDCGGNTGITFPAAKTVYWNLAGSQSWAATAWATASGGSPAVDNYPLAQDTAVFDNAGAAGTVSLSGLAANIGTFDASLRTSAMTVNLATCQVYGNWRHGSGLTFSAQNAGVDFLGNGVIQTITSNGVSFGGNRFRPGTVNGGKVILADAFITTGQMQYQSGEFDANNFNVTAAGFEANSTSLPRILRMGSGLWTMTSASPWTVNAGGTFAFYKGTANILLSDTSTSARYFGGAGLSYNKLTIGGATGTSTLTIDGNNQFTELASTKTVAHTIALGTTTQTFGKWTVTGTAGNVVTLTGTGTSHSLVGACTSGIDYLAMGSIGFAATSPGEFYAGANSTGTAGAPVYRTAKPADSTRYWVGGTGNWSDTARWSTSSGGASGASVPRSHDDVVFNSASNATAYTATVDAVTGGVRMKALTIAGPASGNVTLAGSTAMVGIHGNVTLPATGLTRTYNGDITLSSNSTGLTFTTNGVALGSSMTINGVDCVWSLGFALNNQSATGIYLVNGELNTAGYALTASQINSSYLHSRKLTLGASAVSITSATGISASTDINFTVDAGTSTITFTTSGQLNFSNPVTFNNVIFSAASSLNNLYGPLTFNNLTFNGRTSAGLNLTTLRPGCSVTVTGTLAFSAGTNATMRLLVQSDTIGATRTITAAAVSMTDVDFRDVTIAGAAAPASGTRLGDCKGNSGITFTAAANKYWNLAAGGNWSATGWATTSGGSPAVNNFPLAQDTCFFEATGLNNGATVTVNQSYNIGTIDMSARTANTMTLATGSTAPFIYGNWVNGTGTTLSGTGTITFAGRGSQTLTSAGKTFTQTCTVDSIAGSLTLQDAYENTNVTFTLTNGEFNTGSFAVTVGALSTSNSNTRTLAIGTSTFTITGAGGSAWNTATSTNLTVTGTGTISLTSASAKTFAGGGISYTNITLNQGGAGTLSISGNNTLKDITNTYKATGATTISMGTTTQRVSQWTAAGEAGRLLTIQGTSASSPCTLIHTGTGTAANVDYLVITGVRAY